MKRTSTEKSLKQGRSQKNKKSNKDQGSDNVQKSNSNLKNSFNDGWSQDQTSHRSLYQYTDVKENIPYQQRSYQQDIHEEYQNKDFNLQTENVSALGDITNRGRISTLENGMESSRRLNPIRQYLDGEHLSSEIKTTQRKLQSSQENIKFLLLNQSQNTPIETRKKLEISQHIEDPISNTNKSGNIRLETLNFQHSNKESIDILKHKNEQIQDLTKQITQLKIQNEKLQRRILELQYEMENYQKENKNIENIQFQEKVVEERQISLRKSELELEQLTKEMKRESENIIKQRQFMQQEALIHKKQIEVLAKEQERLNEEAKKLKLWEEKVQEQDRNVKEKILKFENRGELLNEKENALKRHENQIEQKRIFVLQLIERLGQHDEQLYSYAKQCEQRCEKIDQFQNLLYNQILHHDDLDLRMEGLRLNESIFQKKMDLEISTCINQVHKLKEKETHLQKREKVIQQQNEKRQLQQNQQKLAKSMDKPIAFSEYSNLKQSGQSSRNKNANNSYQISSSENISSSTSTTITANQLQFKSKNNQKPNQISITKGKAFKKINTSQQNYSLQINSNQNDSNNHNLEKTNTKDNFISQKKRRSESHQTLSNSAINLNNNIYQNDCQTTLLSFDNNLDQTVVTQHQTSQNPIIKLNQFASQEDISVVLPPNNMQNNGILMTSYHLDEDIAYLCQEGQKEEEQIRQISIMASPQLHFSEQARQQQQILQDQYQTFQKENFTENTLTKGTNCGSSGQNHSELKIDLSSLQSNNDNQNEKQLKSQQGAFFNDQFLSLPYQQKQYQQQQIFTNQFNVDSIAKEIIQDDNLLSNRDYYNSDELEKIRQNRKINQTPQTTSKQQKQHNKVLQEIAKSDIYSVNSQQFQQMGKKFEQVLD